MNNGRPDVPSGEKECSIRKPLPGKRIPPNRAECNETNYPCLRATPGRSYGHERANPKQRPPLDRNRVGFDVRVQYDAQSRRWSEGIESRRRSEVAGRLNGGNWYSPAKTGATRRRDVGQCRFHPSAIICGPNQLDQTGSDECDASSQQYAAGKKIGPAYVAGEPADTA